MKEYRSIGPDKISYWDEAPGLTDELIAEIDRGRRVILERMMERIVEHVFCLDCWDENGAPTGKCPVHQENPRE